MHHKYIQNEILLLKDKKNVNKPIYKKFVKRLQNKNFIRSECPKDHYCVFFLPIDSKTKSIFLGHHIKADDWIPPGGHIEKDEHPIDTIKREMFEELKHKITNEKIFIFDLTIKNMDNPLHPCKRHYDMWYLVFMDKTNFIFNKKEFYNACWLNIEKAKSITKEKDYIEVICKATNMFLDYNI